MFWSDIMKTENIDLDVKLIPFKINEELRTDTVKSIYGVEMIKAKSIWEDSNKGAGVKIAVIDSGCDINHKSLKNNIIGVRNFTDEDKKNPNIVIDSSKYFFRIKTKLFFKCFSFSSCFSRVYSTFSCYLSYFIRTSISKRNKIFIICQSYFTPFLF